MSVVHVQKAAVSGDPRTAESVTMKLVVTVTSVVGRGEVYFSLD